MLPTFLKNALNLVVFTHASPPTQNFLPSFFHHPPGREIPPCSVFFEDLFSPAAERGGGNLLYQTSSGKYDGDLEQQVIDILHDLEFVQM